VPRFGIGHQDIARRPDARLRRRSQLRHQWRIRRRQILPAAVAIHAPRRESGAVETVAAERAAAGIPEALIRYSVGIEDAEGLTADLAQALEKSFGRKRRRARA